MSRLHWIAVVVAAVVMGAACSPSGYDVAVETATPTPEPAPTEEPTPEPTEEPTAEPTEEPTAEPTEEPTAEPTEEPPAEPTEEPTAEPTEEPPADPFPITAGGDDLFGVAFGTDAEPAIALFNAIVPGALDSGWIQGCPLDGEELNERSLTWGGLRADFYRDDTGEYFESWQYRLDFETLAPIPGGPTADQVLLPGGFLVGDQFDTVVVSYGGTPTVDDVFGVPIYFGDALVLLGRDPVVTSPIVEVGTPFVGFCE